MEIKNQTMFSHIKLSIGAILFFWDKNQLLSFYQKIRQTPVDVIYLGETVCSRRQQLRSADWLELAEDLLNSGKEIILSSQTLLESESDLKRLRQLTEQKKFTIEANDFAAVKLARANALPFVAGASLNIYNADTLALMRELGAIRWVPPVEMSAESLSKFPDADKKTCELFAWGKLPLAFSARCFTARHYNLNKDDCQFKCLQHPDAMTLKTREGKEFLAINGTQTMSSSCQFLLPHAAQINQLGIGMLRLSPQSQHMPEIIQLHRDALDGKISLAEANRKLTALSEVALVDGYWRGEAGINTKIETKHENP